MNLGSLSKENVTFLNEYKKYGYRTKTQMANDAFATLRQLKAREARERWRTEGFRELAGEERDLAWESLDGEDFRQGR